jgi:hypothetical protein
MGPRVTPPKKPTPPAAPAKPSPPLVALLPQATATVPTDAVLLDQLRKINTPTANAFVEAYQAFGKKDEFAGKLEAALIAVDLPGDPHGTLRPFLIHLARLGAEAFTLHLSVDTDKAFQIGFIDHPDHLMRGQAPQQEQFLYFAVRRLVELSSSRPTPEARRGQMDNAIVLFAFFHAEQQRDDFRLAVATDAVLIDYCQLLFRLIEKHYQALMDDLLADANSGSQYDVAVKELTDHFRALTATDLDFGKPPRSAAERDLQTPPQVPLYLIESNRFRDFFAPSPTSDFAFRFYSRRAPSTAAGHDVVFRFVIRKRHEQMNVLDALRPGPHPVTGTSRAGGRPSGQRRGAPAQPDAPKLRDNDSWQTWVRRMWDAAEQVEPAITPDDVTGRLAEICAFVSRYFGAFTCHVPYDLAEGSGERNYLTRSYPRAITGGLTHDCVVYAIRWLYILGRLFVGGSMPRVMSNPRTSLIEMPAHVGALIRANVSTDSDVVVATNNQDAVVTAIDATLGDVEAAKKVVNGIYPGLKTPIFKRDLTARLSDATALWNEIAKLSDLKLPLPYDDPSEPFLMYLFFNSQSAAIGDELAEQVGEQWRGLQQALEGVPPARRRATIQGALKKYREDLGPLFEGASKQFDKDVVPLANAINADVDAHNSQITKVGAVVVDADPDLTAWQKAIEAYRPQLDDAERSLDISKINPVDFFPEEGFPSNVQ